MTDALWKIGELAKRTGVSVRTLHHYDEIGLLSPSHRTGSRHRLYGRDEVVRLQQILSLRQMGFTLPEIRDALDAGRVDVLQLIRLHVSRIREQISVQEDLCRRLEAIAAGHETATAEELIRAIEGMTMFEKYYTKEQLDTLAARRRMLGETRMREVQEDWTRLMSDVRAHMRAGTDPRDPAVQALARKWNDLIQEFTGGDRGIEQSLRNMYRGEPATAQQQGLDGEMGEYIRRALA